MGDENPECPSSKTISWWILPLHLCNDYRQYLILIGLFKSSPDLRLKLHYCIQTGVAVCLLVFITEPYFPYAFVDFTELPVSGSFVVN